MLGNKQASRKCRAVERISLGDRKSAALIRGDEFVSQLRHLDPQPVSFPWRVGGWVPLESSGSSPLSTLSVYISSILVVLLVVQALCFYTPSTSLQYLGV
jgi:hypothetical protein